MTKTTKCTRRLVQKFVCIWALVLSTHQVASMDLRSKSEARSHNRVLEANPTKMDNAKSSNHGAKSSKSAKSKSSGSGRGAIFAMTNASGGNEIIMYARKKNGRLRYTGSPFSTGGVGGDLVLQSPPDDPLASQNSLVVADNCLLAVNAGSNTLTSFEIRADQGKNRGLHQVSIVGSGGEIPVSIAYSSANRFVYALNSGGPGSISGFTLNDECFLEPIPNSIVSLEQEPSDLLPFPDGPPYFISSPAQIDFTPNSQQLLVTIKGIDGNPLSGGTINQFEVGDTGLVSNKRITETGNDSIAPFSFDFDDDENLLVVNAFGSRPPNSENAGSVSLYNFNGINGQISLVQNEPIGQTASCWIKYSNGCAFTTNNGSSSISSLSVSDDNIELIDNVAASLNNPIDEIFSPDGHYLYALSTGHTSGGQPQIYVYAVMNDCGLRQKQVISEGLPHESVTIFGAVGLAVF